MEMDTSPVVTLSLVIIRADGRREVVPAEQTSVQVKKG